MVLLVIDGQHGMGRHSDTVSAADSVIQKKTDFLLSISLNTSLATIKTSIALALITLCGVHTWLQNTLWVLIGMEYRRSLSEEHGSNIVVGFVWMYTIVAIITITIICSPVEHQWNPKVAGSCWSLFKVMKWAMANVGE